MTGPLVCEDCGMVNPPPEQTCGTKLLPRDHFVGMDRGCPHCGRLVQACARRPCSVWRSMESGLGEDDGGSGG